MPKNVIVLFILHKVTFFFVKKQRRWTSSVQECGCQGLKCHNHHDRNGIIGIEIEKIVELWNKK